MKRLFALVLAGACLAFTGVRGEALAWNGERAMGDIARLLEFTPRSPGKPGHAETVRYIEDVAAGLPKLEIRKQSWSFANDSGETLPLTNIVVRLNPAAAERTIVATHYDSIVRAYRDPKTPFAKMPGANNSASGVALLLETLRVMAGSTSPDIGVDFVFFDGEEGQNALGAGDARWFALGSPYFAQHLSEIYPGNRPKRAVVFDMVCYRKLKLKQEPMSLAYAPDEVAKFWKIGARRAPAIFTSKQTRMAIGDDQMALNQSAIPSFLVIGFEYEPWFNTTKDTLDKCSAETLSGVGRTLVEYLNTP
ncbi:MAG: M28 family peptidase [Proteobacteria bacterium]|nr:M28 family peptidase [Pseudomonadota bacterium]